MATLTQVQTVKLISGSLKNAFDKDKVQSEINLQRTVSQNFSRTSQQVNAEFNKKIDTLTTTLKNNELSASERADLQKQLDNWQRGQVVLNMLASGLSAPTQNAAGIATATVAPAVSYEIGQYFKSTDQEGSLRHLLSHAILGATVAQTGGNNALAGAISAGGAEAAAPGISQLLFGTNKPGELTAEQKETLSSITNLLGTAAGAAVGGNSANAVQGSLNAQSAVENNWLSAKQLIEAEQAYLACDKDEICKQKVIDSAQSLSQAQDSRLTMAKIQCAVGFCDDLKLMNNQWVYSLNPNNAVSELRKYYPNASYQQLIQIAQKYAAEADSSFNQGTTRFIVGALNDLPVLGLAGKQISVGAKGASNLFKYRINPNVKIGEQKYHVPLPTLHPNRVTVYRVEGMPNTRLLITNDGMVQIQGNTTLYLNFGDRKRAIQYLEQKVGQNLPDAQVKTFTVPKSVVDDLNKRALPENKVKTYDPNRLQPVVADPTKAANQFGIRPHDFRNFENQIIKGSGKNGR